MSKMQRTKGQSFEREICAVLQDELGIVVKRNLSQTRGGKDEGSDITVGRWSIECKRRAKIALYEWLDQAIRDAPMGTTPVVVARADGRRAVVVMDFEAFIPLMREWLNDESLKEAA